MYLKAFVTINARTAHQDGRILESWVTEQLKQLGEYEYFALKDWLPICDGLLKDDEVENRGLPGRLGGKAPF